MPWLVRMSALRAVAFFISYPNRVFRWIKWLFWLRPLKGRHRVLRWFAGLVLLTTDLTPLAFIYSMLMDLIKPESRPMSHDEIAVGKSVFGQAIPWPLISMDSGSLPAWKKWAKAYVQFYTINFHQSLPDHMLIHELVHVWQYKQMGSVYISEAIWAQRWGGGYNYGGIERLRQLANSGLDAFNLEQQADIIEDYFRWKSGMPLIWALNVPGIGAVLEKYVKDVRK